MRAIAVAVAAASAAAAAMPPIPGRVEALLSQMTLAEKVAQLFHLDSLSFEKALSAYGNTSWGASSIQPFSPSQPVSEDVQQRNALQAAVMNQSRLGIPVMFSNEGLHGGAKGGTIFPELVTVGSTWNTSLAQSIGQVIAFAGRASGADMLFGPVINLFMDPRFGRLQEGFAGDPTITYHMGWAYTSGLQGDGGSGPETYLGPQSVNALAKHFAAYGAAMGGLNAAPAEISNRTLMDVYLKPWRSFALHAGGRGAMPSHQTIHDVPCHSNPWLVNSVFRGTLGFGMGVTVSDCNDIGVLQDYRVAVNSSHRAALGIQGGVDMDLMCGSDPTQWSYPSLIQSVAEGLVAEEDIDTAVSHVLTHKFAAGLFDQPMTNVSMASQLNSPAHQQLAREAAQQGVVLLANNNSMLPFQDSSKIRRIAVIGPNGGCVGSNGTAGPPTDGCDARQNILGSYTQISKFVTVATIHEALLGSSFVARNGIGVTYSQGAQIDSADTSMIPQAVAAAQQADVAIVVLGDSLNSCGEWADRDSLDLPGSQLDLLAALQANTSTPVVVVLIHGRPATFGPNNALLSGISALLSAYRPGQLGSDAIVDILTGVVNPSGKLVHSWPRTVGQVQGGASPWLQQIRGKWISNSRGTTVDPDGRRYDPYVNSDSTPLFPFGFGLSYTVFNYQSLQVAVNSSTLSAALVSAEGSIGRQELLQVSITVANTGTVDGQEIVQVFAVDPIGVPFARYWKRLVGFGRLFVAAGTQATITIPVLVDDLAFSDSAMQYRVVPGQYQVRVGGSSVTDLLVANVTLATSAKA